MQLTATTRSHFVHKLKYIRQFWCTKVTFSQRNNSTSTRVPASTYITGTQLLKMVPSQLYLRGKNQNKSVQKLGINKVTVDIYRLSTELLRHELHHKLVTKIL